MDSSKQETLGAIHYNDDVIKTMVTMVLNEVEGIATIENRTTAGNLLGRKNNSHINKISVDGKSLTIELTITIDYGLSLMETARKAQQKIKEKIESMTDLTIGAINITISGLDMKEALEN